MIAKESQLQEAWKEQERILNEIREYIHYPECWDDAMGYPTLADAVIELIGKFDCQECYEAKKVDSVVVDLTEELR